MALLFCDGFDHYATGDTMKKWNAASGHNILPTSGRRGGGCIDLTYYWDGLHKTFPVASSSWVVGVALKPSALGYNIFQIIDVGTVQCLVRMNADGTFSVVNGNNVVLGTSTYSVAIGTWYYIEWKVTIANSIAAGSCKVRVNGMEIISVAAGADTQNSANATANVFNLTGGHVYDDLYVCDQNGTANIDFLGDVRIDTLLPSSDGTYTQFTPNTGFNHYSRVNEAAPDLTSYNSSSTVGSKDSYHFAALTIATGTIKGVQLNNAVMKDDSGLRQVANIIKSGADEIESASTSISTTQTFVSTMHERAPGNVAWTQAIVNAAEFGTKVTG